MNLPDFLRLFPLRAPNIMWFLGAGASAAAGVPTAGHMIWDFKRRLYCAENRRPVQLSPDLADTAFRERLAQYFEAKPGFPPGGSDQEYSFYFEQTYPNERERRTYIDNLVSGKRPSHGHLALAALVKLHKVNEIWTTNFDRLLEDALTQALESTSLYQVATLDAPNLAEQALKEGTRPVLVKLHGDFQSRKLMNTEAELRQQDDRLRACLTTACGQKGVALVGYSGRDHSIMDALEQAVELHGERAYPGGLFWFHRPGSKPAERLQRLIENAVAQKVDAHFIEAETFDELMYDLFTLIEDTPDEVRQKLDQHRRRLTPIDIPPPGRPNAWPVIRMNALPVLSAPSVCRKVVCDIGGTAEVRKAVQSAGVDVIALRRDTGVICFGRDDEVRKAFHAHRITEFDLHPIDGGRLDFESTELGLLDEALIRALVRERPLRAIPTRRGWKLFVDPGALDDPRLATLRQIPRGVSGIIAKTDLVWAEAILVKLQRKLQRLWLLFEPSVWVDWPDDAEGDEDANAAEENGLSEQENVVEIATKEFIRERAATRYNKQLIEVLDGWASVIVGPGSGRQWQTTIRSFGIGDGIDASFTLSGTTAFSRRWGNQ